MLLLVEDVNGLAEEKKAIANFLDRSLNKYLPRFSSVVLDFAYMRPMNLHLSEYERLVNEFKDTKEKKKGLKEISKEQNFAIQGTDLGNIGTYPFKQELLKEMLENQEVTLIDPESEFSSFYPVNHEIDMSSVMIDREMLLRRGLYLKEDGTLHHIDPENPLVDLNMKFPTDREDNNFELKCSKRRDLKEEK